MRQERKARKPRPPRAKKPTPPAPLPEGRGVNSGFASRASDERPALGMLFSPLPFWEGGLGGVGFAGGGALPTHANGTASAPGFPVNSSVTNSATRRSTPLRKPRAFGAPMWSASSTVSLTAACFGTCVRNVS